MITEFIMEFPIGLFGIFMSLTLLGYFRSAVENVKPDFILNQKKIQDEWLQRSSFTSLFLPVMALTIFIFNIVAWAVYGLISIAEFLAFILKAIWWIILWIWNELIHPVVFFVVKLLWHYLIIWSWRFFKISFTRIPEAFHKSTLKKGFISVLFLSFVFFFFFYLSNILQQQWILVFMILAFLFAASYFSGYTLYDDENRSFKEYWNSDMMYKLGVMIAICVSAISIILMLNFFYGSALQMPVFGISFPAMQILIIILIVAFISTLVSNTILPAYIASTDGIFDTKEFLTNMVKRLPRLVGSIPYVLFAGAIVSIATVLLGGFLWWSTNTIKTNFCENAIQKVNTRLNEANDKYYSIYDNIDTENLSTEYSKKTFKKIARLESRLFSLDLLREDWTAIFTDLPDGIRNINRAEKEFENLTKDYSQRETSITSEIEESEKRIDELIKTKNENPEDESIEQSILGEKEYLGTLKNELIIHQEQTKLFKKLSEARTKSIKRNNILWIIGTFLGLFGWILLTAIILTPYWIYRTKVYFDLYSYYEDGKSYFIEQVDFYKNRNENQPLLGLFVAIIISVVIIILTTLVL